tara:strand:+ start:880 stop:1401 length:522 start_codon:yes stop_codon:yes gene_type:complete
VALYGGSRDISLFRHINRELMHDIVSQQIVYHKYNLEETKVNIYGETTSGRIFQEPVLLYTLIERSDQSSPILDGVVNFNQPITFKFLRADLVDANVVTEEGDIIQWQNAYWEIDNIISNQYFVGKNPDYPNTDSTGTNPLESDLADFGTSLSLICNAHYVPADRIGLDKQRI